jgi:hypothetical protein
MRRLRGGGVTLALLLGLAGPILAAEPLDAAGKAAGGSASSSGSWWGSWFGHKEQPEDKKPHSPAEKSVTPPAPAETAVTIRQREWDAYWRRNEVCLRLKQAAQVAGDDEQVRRIEQLEDRIWTVFQQRLASLPGGGTSEQDESTLEQNLNTAGRKPVLFQTDNVGTAGTRAGLFGGGDKP